MRLSLQALAGLPRVEICYTQKPGAVPKRPKGEVCNTSIRGFGSHPRLQFVPRRVSGVPLCSLLSGLMKNRPTDGQENQFCGPHDTFAFDREVSRQPLEETF